MAAVLNNVMFLDEEIYAQKHEYVIELCYFVRVYHSKKIFFEVLVVLCSFS